MADETAPPASAGTLDLAKVLRLKSMLEVLRAEVRSLAPDAGSLARLATMQNEIEDELGSAVPDELEIELTELSSCCRDNPSPSESEIRVAQAQLIGWIEGLLHGVGLSVAAQQRQQQLTAGGQPAAPETESFNPKAYL